MQWQKKLQDLQIMPHELTKMNLQISQDGAKKLRFSCFLIQVLILKK